MISLKNGCTRSNLAVNPKNWKTTKASSKQDWYIMYRFYDPLSRDMYPKGKQIQIKGMNSFKDLKKRQEATQIILEYELSRLDKDGFNPISGIITSNTPNDIISSNTPFLTALDDSYKRLKADCTTLSDVRSILRGVSASSIHLRLNNIPISEIRRKHMIMILERCSVEVKGWSSNRFNKYKAYLSMLFNELVQIETIEFNPMKGIAKEKTIKKARVILSNEERKKIDKYLKLNNYPFWRFTQIFFHSGARESELMEIKTFNVDLQNQQFLVVVNKGKSPAEYKKPIKNIVLPLWTEIIKEAKEGQYLFSKGLKPGDVPINANQITRRWRTHIKGKLHITADFYSLKHSNLDEISAELSIQDAAKMASHTSIRTTEAHYATNEAQRQMDRLKNMNNSFS